jgi:hypothetical protein
MVWGRIVAKYEVWGRVEIRNGKRRRLAFGFSKEVEAKKARAVFLADGFQDCIVVQRPPRYGSILGLQKAGRKSG